MSESLCHTVVLLRSVQFKETIVSPTPSRLRRWPALLILACSGIALLFIWMAEAPNRQDQVMQTMSVVGVALILLVLWLLLFSRLAWRVRIGALILLLAVIGSTAMLFRVRGFSGDLIPIVELRASAASEQLPASSAPITNAPASLSPKEKEAQALPESTAVKTILPSKPAALKHETSNARVSRDYAQFLGPERNGKLVGIKLARDWQTQPPKLLWRNQVGTAWSSFAVAGNHAITHEQHGAFETVTCYDLKTGAMKWRHRDSTAYESPVAGSGPRATPTIVGNLVYAMGATGMLNCLRIDSGERVWAKDVIADNDAKINSWGMSCSPLVLDSLVIVSAGGTEGKSLVAYHAQTGARVWSAGNDRAGYSSPQLTTIAGAPQILIFNRANVVAHAPDGGKIFWQQAWPVETECVAQPLPLAGDRVFVTSGYGTGCKLFQIARDEHNGWSSALVWENINLKAKFTNVVEREGFVYGLDDGILVCLDLATGRRAWKRGRYGHGQLILIDDLLLIQAESGEVFLVEANPRAHVELGNFRALEGKTWNNPAFAAPYLLVRNDREAACYEIALAPSL